jgi:hypothetical protein
VFLIRLVLLPIRVALGSMVVGYKVGSLLGYRRLLTFAVGVGVGLLLAPVPGEQLRQRVRGAIGTAGADRSPGGLADAVRTELSQSPRTWHLPQPEVEASGARVVLQGQVPHEEGRADIERTVSAVPGVAAVDNRLVVSPPPGGSSNGAGTNHAG